MNVLTQYPFYQRELKESFVDNGKKTILLMREGESYSVLGPDADIAYEELNVQLTHKDAGKMFCYDTENYAYHLFSFGRHNLYLVTPHLWNKGYNVYVTDYSMYLDDAGGWDEMERIMAKHKQQEEEERKRNARPVQTSLFDNPLFWA